MSSRIRTLNFLPEIFQTKTNAQFLAATLDQVTAQPETKRIEGYVGTKFGYGINAKDYYVTEPTKVRTDYQLDPGVVFTKPNETTAKDFISYPGMIDALKLEGGITTDNNKLFNSQFYSWDSFTCLDKIINFNQYYWIPEGPERVVVSSDDVFFSNDYVVYDLANGYNIAPATSSESAGSTNATLTLLRGGTYTFLVNQATEFWIQGQPGVTGYSPTQPNVQTRDVLGVDNNGASQGIITFTVPAKNEQDQYNFPGNNLVDVVSTMPFSDLNGARLADLSTGVDGVTSLNGLTVMFYNTGVTSEVGYVSNFFDYTAYDTNNDLVGTQTTSVTATSATTNLVTCNSTGNLIIGGTVVFTGIPFGGLSAYSETLPSTIYYVTSIVNGTQFTVSTQQPAIAIAEQIKVGSTYIITSLGTTNFTSCGSATNTVGATFTATSSGLGTGTARELTSGQQFKIGETYTITTIGTTDFTLIGAASNTQGLSFVATGAGTVTAGSFVSGLLYEITTLGDTDWNIVANTTGATYQAGDLILAAASGSGTGQALQVTTGSGSGTAYIGAANAVLSSASGSMTLTYNLGLYEEGYYTNVTENFYTIQYVGDPTDPVIRLLPSSEIPVNQKITATYGTQWITRTFYRDTLGLIQEIPYLSSQLETLYYQDGTSANKVGTIRLIESNALNTLNVDTTILGKQTFTATNGVVFTNGLKVSFQGDVIPIKYKSGEYYVEGVGSAIELLPVENFVAPEQYSQSTYIAWDTAAWDTAAWEGNSYIPVVPDYITIARNSIDKNAWSRSNRWFHIDVINDTATYNNNPDLLTLYATSANKAKRPIIEFYHNLKLFDSGVEGKDPVDFIDVRTTDAFSLVAGQQNYYPDVEVYTAYTGSITSTNYTAVRSMTAYALSTMTFTADTTGFRNNDLIVFDAVPPGLGINNGEPYYVTEIVSGSSFKISNIKGGANVGFSIGLPGGLYTGPWNLTWIPQSTIVTIAATDVVGNLTVGQYIADSKNVLPRNSQIGSISGTSTLSIVVEWDSAASCYLPATTTVSLIATDTTNDNYSLFDGARIVFAADTDANVRNKIYVSRLSVINGSSIPIITLTEINDGDVLPDQQTVALRGFFNHGIEYWFNGDVWQPGQQKTDVNQPPQFDIYDTNGISFGNKEYYFGTSFTGSKLFAYGIGYGLDDSVLGFPLRYSQVDNVGDISFDVSLNIDTFNYVNGTNPVTQHVNTGYVYQYTSLTNRDRQIGWKTAVSPSVQYQIFEFSYDPLVPSNTFVCDINKWSSTRTNWPTIQVYVNNVILPTSEYTVTVGPVSTTVTLSTYPVTETVIQVSLLSDQVSPTAYYSIPINLNNNPLNTDLTTANVGDIRGQYQSIFYNNSNTTGKIFGPNNFRDLGNLVPWGNKIIQNSAALVLPGLFLRKQEHNLFNSLLFNGREYVKFKNMLAYTVQHTDYVQQYNASVMLDDALGQMTDSKNDSQPFFWSDMLPSKAPYVQNTYSFANSLDVSIYPLTKIYNFAEANYYGVLVYLTRTTSGITVTNQLLKDQDYVVSDIAPSLTVTLNLLPGDTITVKEYNQTYGSYVPNTPTKLGLYPSYTPAVVLDSNYNEPTYFIKGHDGSYTKLYGNYDPTTGFLDDFRDQVLLEFETRIFNNLKIVAEIPIKEYEVLPGFFRETDYTYSEWLSIYSSNFLNWIGQNRLNYKTQYYNSNNNFTYNYYQTGNAINNEPITPGYWRGVYQYFYDTTTPNTSPWEMLGFTQMPSWWTSRYGPAPYTSDNLVLWTDLAEGINWNNGNPVVIPQAVRNGLLDIIPVNEAGELLAPIESLVGSYNQKLFQRDWKVGDSGPVEFSYRRSSSYPFDLMKMMALMKPAEFFNLAVDVDKYKYNEEFNQYLMNDRSHLKLNDINIYGTGTPVTSYINWIVDYEKQVGIAATTNIQTALSTVDVRLVYRLAGFSDKNMLKFYVEKGTPNSRNASLLIPDESYGVLLYDNQPFNRITYSGVIIQITSDGNYSVYGNSQTFAYFKTLKPRFAGKSETITVEGLTVKVTTDHYDREQIIPYNTTFYTAQEVAQFLVDYGAYLVSLGMKFQDQEQDIEITWNQMVAEFLYWAQTGWSPGSVVTLNPSAKTLLIDKDSNIVQPLTIQQSNFVLNQNLYPIQINDLAIVRQGTSFNVTALNAGDVLSFGQFNLSNFEHGIVFDNVTLFGDILYNLTTGLRQNRILLRGTMSAGWNGTVDAAGFIYNQNNILEWSNLTKYTKGEIVRYKNKYWVATRVIQASETFTEEYWKRTDYAEIQKGLLPNASTRSYESTLYYDIDKANLENDADLLSFSLIGYRPRDYLALADLTDITQINVYRNLIKSKGTLNAANAFKGANLPQGGIDYDIYENWAIKAGEFGGVLNNNFVEFKINQTYMTGNPAIAGLTDGIYNVGVQQEVPLYSLFNYGRPITSVDVLPTIPPTDPSTVYPDAGYVNYNDVKMAAFFYSQMGTAINKNGTIIPIENFYVRDYVWLANFLEKWQAFTPTSLGQVTTVTNNLNDTLTITFDAAHNLNQYDPFAVVNFDTAIDGYFIATAIIDQYSVLVNKTVDTSIKTIIGQGVGLAFTSQRVATPAEIIGLPLLDSEFRKNTVWVDTDTSGSWGVYRKGINYQLENQLTNAASESFGSAVAIGDTLGYLIGDAAAGKAYRYTYNDLGKVYELTQTLPTFPSVAGTSFGSTISYSGDLYAIAETTGLTRCIRLYQLQHTTQSDDLILYQTLSYPAGATIWGTSIAISGDTRWIYVSDIDNNTVHVYQRSAISTQAGYFVVGKTYTIESVGDTSFVDVGATSNDVGISFIATGAGTGSGVATLSTYEHVSTIDGDALGLTASGDNFGYSISTDYLGGTIVIGAPNQNYDVSTENWGYTYIFNKSIQNFEAQYTSKPYVSQQFPLAWTPDTIYASVISTSASTNAIQIDTMISDTSAFVVGYPIIFSGTILTDCGLAADKVYYINTIVDSSHFKVSETRIGAVVSLNNASGAMDATVQSSLLFVEVNGNLLADNNYAVINSTINIIAPLTAGDIVNVSGSNFVLCQTLTTEKTPQIGVQFGLSTDITTSTSEIIVGAPFQLNSQLEEGAVIRFTSAGAKYGSLIGTTDCNVTVATTVLINGYITYIPVGNAAVVAEAIKSARITNITAYAIDGKLIISLINNELAPINRKLFLTVSDPVACMELGISIYTKTQEILCPHTQGPTQFGTVVKFNEFDSFVASAPTGTRYSSTTFDFTDDENQDNDTLFDNNATQWVDQTTNFGAVYMFDYVVQYDANIKNTGKYVYAQSVNSPNLVYGALNSYNQSTDVTYNNQPRYGTALDFNNYSVAVGTPNDTGAVSGNTYAGSATIYNNALGVKDWSLYRHSAPIPDINRIFNVQIFSADSNQTLINMDYIDPLQGKILGAARENIDIISNNDPARYNNTGNVTGGIVWGDAQLGQVWLNTKNMRYVNYHQNDDVAYNSQYWATLFPGSDVAVYSWIFSNVLPASYTGPGIPYDINSYSVQYIINASGALSPVYYFWARNTNTIFYKNDKTLADSVIASYIENPKASGISYVAPLLPSVYGLYNSGEYINANDSVLHIGFATGDNDDASHNQFNLIRDGYPSDFLPGIPLIDSEVPDSLYDRLLDSISGVDETGAIVPNPYLPKAVQTGILVRPRQSFFNDRYTALENYLGYANTVLAQYPIAEIRYSSFLSSSGDFYDTTNYWEYINWWAIGYDDNTKSALQVSIYADLSTLQVPIGTIVKVSTNINGRSETYIYDSTKTWSRIGLENGTIKFKSSLWNYSAARLGYGDNFFDTDTYDVYPSEETRKIIRALNEQLYTDDLLIYRNKSLILLFEYIQSEATENQNYLPWLNKTSFIDVSHTIRELKPLEVFQSDNQEFLSGYMNEIKPYHVVIKEFLFKYTGSELYAGTITDFDLPAKYDTSIEKFVTPMLVYQDPSGSNQFVISDPLWQDPDYVQWFNNHGVSLAGQLNVQITTLASYISLNTDVFVVDNASGFPINGVIKIGTEQIGYSSVDRSLNTISGLSRGANGTAISTHIPGDLIYIDLPPALLLNGGRGYSEPPKVIAYIDTSIYPAPTTPAVLTAVMNLDQVLRIDVINPGSGYAVLPEIIIDSAIVVTFSSTDVNPLASTIQVYAPTLQTGDLIQYKVGANSTTIGGLENDQWYYINVLETVPAVVIGFYDNYTHSIKNQNRLVLYTQGTGSNHSINVGARASVVTSATPVRENNISLRFDRTTYTSQIIDWIAGRYYGAFYAGSYHNSESIASSSITLENTQPPVASILASAQGAAFEITDVRNDRLLTYSSLIRYVQSTETSDDSVKLILQDDGSGNPNASGGTIGFYIGMPIKFVGAVGTSGIVNEQLYYVNSILNQTDFTLSSDPSGSPILGLNDQIIGAAGLQCLVGEVTDAAVITVNYPGILPVSNTTATTNHVIVPLNSTGTGGTAGFYINLPIFFTGTDSGAPQNGVFGGIIENQVYYITTVVDDQIFTMSEKQNPKTFNVISTVSLTDTVLIDGDTSKLAVNEPIIFNTMVISGVESTTFGGLISGTTYYVANIAGPGTLQVSAAINGPISLLSDVAIADDTSALITSQIDTVALTTATGNMVVNVSLPVSPGQVNGQKFTLYQTSTQYPNVTGTTSNLVTRGVAALIGDRTIDSVVVNVNSVVLTNFNPGDTVALELTNIYVNMPLEISETFGPSYLTAGTTYYVAEKGIISIIVTNTSSSNNRLTCDTTEMLYADLPIVFSGAGVGGIQIDVDYWVKEVIDDHHFTVTNTPGGLEITVSTASGSMIGTGLPYIKLATTPAGIPVNPGNTQQDITSITIGASAVITVPAAPAELTKIQFIQLTNQGGSLPAGIAENTTYYVRNVGVPGANKFNISLTTAGPLITTSGSVTGPNLMIITQPATMDQMPAGIPVFDVSYILGGYRVLILDQSTGFAISNLITIPGIVIGGTTPINDLTITVNAIDASGAITSVICSGTPAGTQEQFYLKVVSPNEFALFKNQLMTVPASGLTLPYVGTTEATVTGISSSNDRLTIGDTSVFQINDAVVFTGDVQTSITNITQGVTYYIYDIPSSTQFRICTVVGDVLTIVNMVTTIGVNFVMAKSGSFALLPEPFIFNQSMVKYNNRVYMCVVSNNDTEFVFGKWQLLDSGDRKLNAMDRVHGYYYPTDNMPGVDLTQLFDGVTYPNSTYKGNVFAPEDQYAIDAILQDQQFYPTEVDIKAVAWNGSNYLAPADMPTYSSVISSPTGDEWAIKQLANTPLGTTDLVFAGGYYLLTTTNPATPIFRSQDGIIWTTNGYFTPWGGQPYDETNYDMTALSVSSLYLNSAAYRDSLWVAVGQNIVSSDNTYLWKERFTFTNPLLSNSLYGVDNVSISSFTGFIAVGKGQEFDYSGPITATVDINLIITSTDGLNWVQLSSIGSKGLYAVADNGSIVIAVGEDGAIYSSNNGTHWNGVNRTYVTSTNGSTDVLSIVSTDGLIIGTPVRFSNAFDVILTGTTYYIAQVIAETQTRISPDAADINASSITSGNVYEIKSLGTTDWNTVAGTTGIVYVVGDVITSVTSGSGSGTARKLVNLNGIGSVPVQTEMYVYPTTASLRDIAYDNAVFVSVGDAGLIKTSADGITWVTRTSGTTENLTGVIFNSDDSVWVVVGDNNTILMSSDNGASWIGSSVFAPQSTTYNIQGNEFMYGYGPEELVPGVVTDTITMTVATRPGTDWDETIYAHVGYNVVSVEYIPTSATQTTYSFDIGNLYNVQTPAEIAVYIIDGLTGLSTAIYETLNYTIDWTTFEVTLLTSLPYLPVANKLRIDVYETGNGNQLVKASTKTDPIRINATTGWNEIYVNCNYTGQIYSGSGVVRPDSVPIGVEAIATDSLTNSIQCMSVESFGLNDPITFQGQTFGGIAEDTTYYVKTISYITNRITISTTVNAGTGTAGPTYSLTSDTGSMYVIIKVGPGAVYTAPLVYHNGNKLLLGHTNTITRTKSIGNTITTNTTIGMLLNERIVFSDTMFGGILQPQITYYIKSIYDINEFTVSATPGGAVIALTDATGGAKFITNDYAFGIADNGISAAIVFSTGDYDASVDYITYTLFAETLPIQYGYTIPETELFTGTGAATTFVLTNYVGGDNLENAIVEVNGLRQSNTAYSINSFTNDIVFTTPPGLDQPVAVTTFNLTDRQYLNTQYDITGIIVDKIVNINNTITPVTATTNCTASAVSTNIITCVSTSGFVVNQTVVFKGATSFGNIALDGTVYFIKEIVSITEFKISATEGGVEFVLSNGSGLIVAYVGGQPAVRITTSAPHGLVTNNIVRIDGTQGSVQLNNKTFYVHKISDTVVDLYQAVFNPALAADNVPVISISSYVSGSGGFIWLASSYVLVTTIVTETITDPLLGNRLTVADTSMLVAGTPIIFTGASLGGVELGSTYYILDVINSTEFSITDTRNGSEFVLTNATGSMQVTQWEQDNVDRLWVTLNGYRIPSSSLRLNPGNEVSILAEVTSTDKVIITSMMPSATPNEEVYLLNVNQTGVGEVYRANTQTRTWLVKPLSNTDSTIYVNDVSRLTDTFIQTSTVPAAIDAVFNVGLTANKRMMSSVTVYNDTTGQLVSTDNYSVVVENLSPILKLTGGVIAGDVITITILEGNLLYVNGEQIKFSSVNLADNTLTGLQRGANGTGEQVFIPVYTELFGILTGNLLGPVDYATTWNSYVYNTMLGDPLQISTTSSATFLRGDLN